MTRRRDPGRPRGRRGRRPVAPIDDLRTLVRTPSVTGDEEAVPDRGRAAARARSGVAVERIEPDPATSRAGPGLAGRGDAARRRCRSSSAGSAGRAAGGSCSSATSTSCRPAIRRPGRSTRGAARSATAQLYGRGACDMKGGVAAILGGASGRSATRGAADALDGRGPRRLRARRRRTAGRACSPRSAPASTGDMAVITEPTGLDVVIAHAGAITFRLTVPGRAAHASHAPRGRVRARQAVVLVRALEADEAAPQRRRDRPADDRPRPALRDDHRARSAAASGPRP